MTIKRDSISDDTEEMPKSYEDLPPRAKTVIGVIDNVKLPLAFKAMQEEVKNEGNQVSVYTLDLMAIGKHEVPIAMGISKLAAKYPVMGAWLDRIADVTPFSAILTSVLTLGMQIAENHKLIPDNMRGSIPGIVPRDELAQEARVLQEYAAKMNGHSDATTTSTD